MLFFIILTAWCLWSVVVAVSTDKKTMVQKYWLKKSRTAKILLFPVLWLTFVLKTFMYQDGRELNAGLLIPVSLKIVSQEPLSPVGKPISSIGQHKPDAMQDTFDMNVLKICMDARNGNVRSN